MPASDPLDDLLVELRRLKAEGVETVVLSEESQVILSGLVGQAPVKSIAAPTRRSPVDVPAPAASVRPSVLAEPRPVPAAPIPKPVPQAPRVDDSAIPEPPKVELPAAGSKADRLAALAEVIRACPECRRHLRPGTRQVLGEGDAEAAIVFVGEAPGEEDERAGRPFAGPTGELLDRALKAMGLSRDRVYLAHLMQWRPETPTGLGTRTPTARELAFCAPYLRAQLAVIRPRVVVALGGTVFHALTGDKARISEARGVWRELDGLALLPTFHPSYLLKNPSNGPKRQFWEDLLAVMEKAGLPISEKQRGFFR